MQNLSESEGNLTSFSMHVRWTSEKKSSALKQVENRDGKFISICKQLRYKRVIRKYTLSTIRTLYILDIFLKFHNK